MEASLNGTPKFKAIIKLNSSLPVITLVVSPNSVTEDGTPNLVYTFTRTGDKTNALTVNYSIAGTADATDYTGATPGTGKIITFAAGSAIETLNIDPTADATIETDETVALTLAIGTGYTVGTTTAVTGTITNDDNSTLLNPADFTLNASAKFTTGTNGVLPILRLTDDYGQSGSAFLTNAVNLSNNASFSSYFKFQITDSQGLGDEDGAGADGLVFTIQTIANNVGGFGGGIGYAGIDQSLGVEFDTYNNGSNNKENNGNHIGININGDVNSVASQPVANRLNNGNIWSVWVDYNGVSDVLEVRISETNLRPSTAFLSYTIDLPNILTTNNAFIGFTSGTGSGKGDHDILDWQFNNSYNPIDLPSITLAVSPASVLENGITNLVYTFTRTGATTSALTVNYGITGTAGATDYTGATPGTGKTITFAAG